MLGYTLQKTTEDQSIEPYSPFQQIEDDLVDEISRPPTSNFSWPPPPNDEQSAPTASPLYIPPPGTQRVQVKTLNQTNESNTVSTKWTAQQSRSAPELVHLTDQRAESSESCTSTNTTTTTSTSDFYHNTVYQSQTSNVTHNIYDQSHSDYEYGPDTELSAIHNYPYNSFSSMSTDLMSFSGRRSAQECSDTISQTVDTHQLVNYIKELTPAPHDLESKVSKHVGFVDEREPREKPSIIEVPSAPSLKPLPPSNIPNPTPKQWISPMVRALTTASKTPFHVSESPSECYGCEILPSYNDSKLEFSSSALDDVSTMTTSNCCYKTCETTKACSDSCIESCQEVQSLNSNFTAEQFIEDAPRKGSILANALTTASPYTVEWTKAVDDPVPLPEESAVYVPSAISMTPYEKEDYSKKSCLVDALTTAPFRSYTPFEHDVISQLEDLPTPTKEGTFLEALTVAPTEPILQLNKELPAVTEFEKIALVESERQEAVAEEVKQIICSTIESNLNQNFSPFAQISGFRSVNPFKANPKPEEPKPIIVVEPEPSSKSSATACLSKEKKSKDQHVSFPPPPTKAKSFVQSGLHKPEIIPKYQRQWFNLPSQSPVRTPEPPELKENVPLAFVDAPHAPPSQEPPAAITVTAATEASQSSESHQKSVVPVILEDRANSVSMPFQEFDQNQCKRSTSPFRPHTPSLINKPAPAIPYYQQNLVAEECPPSPSLLFDPRVQSPMPDRAKSPAPGPPPNPLRIHAPRIRNASSPTNIPLTQSALNHLQQLDACHLNSLTSQSGQILTQTQSLAQSGARSMIDKPEVVDRKQIGNLNIQTKSKEQALNEQKKSDFQSATVTQIGNTQVQRKTRVVEEFEHSQKAKSVEIYKTYGGQQKSITSGTGIAQTQMFPSAPNGIQQTYSATTQCQQNFANATACSDQTKKESFVAQQARRLSTKSQYAVDLAAYNSKFPNIHTVTSTSSTFPIKSFQPIQETPKPPTYTVIKSPNQSLSASKFPKDVASNKPSQTQSFNISSTLTSSTTATAPMISSQLPPPPISTPSTDYSTKLSTAIPVPAFKPPLSAANDFKPTNQSAPQFKPQPSSGPGFKPPIISPSAVVSDPSPASAGPNKGLTFGATSAPRRGRGILNKAVGAGGRIPQCGCCNAQIRGPFITALGRIWCPDHFVCVTSNCRRPLQDIGFVEEKGELYCEFCFEKYLAPPCDRCGAKIKGDCLNAIGKHFHPECFKCTYCGKLFGNSPFFLEDGQPYCEADWNEMFTTKCFACGFPIESGDRWVEALSHNYHSQCFNCTTCKKNLEGQSFFAKGGRPFCKNHVR